MEAVFGSARLLRPGLRLRELRGGGDDAGDRSDPELRRHSQRAPNLFEHDISQPHATLAEADFNEIARPERTVLDEEG
jgi:hypothetical protein